MKNPFRDEIKVETKRYCYPDLRTLEFPLVGSHNYGVGCPDRIMTAEYEYDRTEIKHVYKFVRTKIR
jgi:hypothetical protein